MRFAIAMMAAGSLAAVAAARAARASERFAAAGSPGDVDEDEGAPMSMLMESPVSSVEDEEAEDAGIVAWRPVGRRPIPALLERAELPKEGSYEGTFRIIRRGSSWSPGTGRGRASAAPLSRESWARKVPSWARSASRRQASARALGRGCGYAAPRRLL